MDEVEAWQARPLDALYLNVYMDCIHVMVRDYDAVRECPVLAIGVSPDGLKEVISPANKAGVKCNASTGNHNKATLKTAMPADNKVGSSGVSDMGKVSIV